MQLIDGKAVSEKVLAEVKQAVATLKARHNLTPGVAVAIVGDDPASQVYIRGKVKTCGELGVYSEKHELPKDATQEQVLALVAKLNADPKIHGILVQSPPPPQIDERAVVEAIKPEKDIDCFHPYNVGLMLIGDEKGFVPCTPQGVMRLLKEYGIETSGKQAVVLGRSNIVGKPMAVLLSRKGVDCTVTIGHSRTRNIAEVCARADILVTAIGRPKFITADMVKPGAVVIDVGISRVPDATKKAGHKLVGDVDFESVAPKTSFISPVPGGVGPMTIAMLMSNAVRACCMQNRVTL